MTRRPRIPLNDYGVLGDPPEPGTWTPRLSVSVVIPAYRAERTLPLTLASLATQSYPSHLLEVIVVDDGEEPMARLPDLAPERTRLIRPRSGSWGKPSACTVGAEVADGHVIHWLDADLVLVPEHVERHMWWHHLAGYLVVLGHLRFVPGLDAMPRSEVMAAIEAGAVDKLFAEEDGTPQWTERRWEQSSDLREAGFKAFTVTVGATASLPAELLRDAGGMDRALVMGEDTELGYRLAQAGAVFVAERGARSWHLGSSTVMRREQDVKRHNWPYLAERVPTFRWLRRHPHRAYLVPYVEAVVRVGDASFEDVRATVDGLLASRLPDVVVKLVGPWGRLGDGRRDPLGDPLLDLRLLCATYEGEARVALCESVPERCFPVPFRFHCPPGWVPSRNALGSLLKFADKHGLGVLSLALEELDHGDEIVHARLERTAAMSRARRCAEPGEDLDDLVHEMFGTLWDAGDKWGLNRAVETTAPLTESTWEQREQDRPAGSRGGTAARRGRLRRTAVLLRRRLRALMRPS